MNHINWSVGEKYVVYIAKKPVYFHDTLQFFSLSSIVYHQCDPTAPSLLAAYKNNNYSEQIFNFNEWNYKNKSEIIYIHIVIQITCNSGRSIGNLKLE